MNRANCLYHVMIGIGLLQLGVLGADGAPQLRLSSNKGRYWAGEPVLLQVAVRTDQQPVVFVDGEMGWAKRFGFSIEIAKDQGAAWDAMDATKAPFPISRVRSGLDEMFHDRYWLPARLEQGQLVNRYEVMVLQPGNYRLRAIIKDRPQMRYQSDEIAIVVSPVDATEPLSKYGDSLFAWRFGYGIFNAHYDQGFGEGFLTEKFNEILSTVVREERSSAFYPYSLYAIVRQRLSVQRSPGPSPAEIEEAIAAGQQFLSAYTDSWLIPEVGVAVCNALVKKGRVEEALIAGRQALAADPNNLMLRNVNFSERLRQIEAKLNAPPVITILGASPVTIECGGAYADARATATDDKDGDITARIVVENNVDALKAGTYQVTYRVVDAAGNTATATRTVKVQYKFDGFLAPIGGADATGGTYDKPVKTFKLGSTIMAKFPISCGGTAVKAGVHTLQVIKYNNATTAAEPIDATPTDAATTGNQFKLSGDEWHFNLDTKATGLSVGTWQLKATLSDGSVHLVWIGLK